MARRVAPERCHWKCPTGVATQKEGLIKGLVVADKSQRVANVHQGTVNAFLEIIAAAGLPDMLQVNRTHVVGITY